MEFLRSLLEQQPLMTLFLTIALGYVVGELNLKGFSLGVGAVLFVALGVGWFAPKTTPPALLGNFGLALFLYAVGILYGRSFFIGLTSPAGMRANLLALIGVLCAGGTTIALIRVMNLGIGQALGLFAGSGTSTATLQAAVTSLGNDDPAVGYSVAYPFGTAGPILLLYLASRALKPRIEALAGGGLTVLEISLRSPELKGLRLGELAATLPRGVQIAALRRDERNRPVSPDVILALNDVLLVHVG